MTTRSRRRLGELADRFGLGAATVAALDGILEILATDPAAPTTISDPRAAVDAHIADALVALDVEALRGAGRIADLGSGAGFPGLVLAAALPQARVALVESSAKKCVFLTRAVEAAGLKNVAVVCSRAEEWTAGMESCDAVTARALAPLNVLAEYAAPLLANGGTLVAWKGRRDAGEERDGDGAASALGLVVSEVRRVQPWAGATNLHLHVYMKVGRTPNRYPRRAGMASKRPLRAST